MTILAQLLVSGIAVGMIYGVIAFGYQTTFATSKTLNFGQGEALMLCALVGLSTVWFLMSWGLPALPAYLLMLPVVIVFGLFQGAVVELFGVRQAIKTKSEAGWIMATIALGIIFSNIAENIWGRDDLRFPSPISDQPLSLAGITVLPMEIVIVVGAIAIMRPISGACSSVVSYIVVTCCFGMISTCTGAQGAMSWKTSSSSSSWTLRLGICPATILQKMQLGSCACAVLMWADGGREGGRVRFRPGRRSIACPGG